MSKNSSAQQLSNIAFCFKVIFIIISLGCLFVLGYATGSTVKDIQYAQQISAISNATQELYELQKLIEKRDTDRHTTVTTMLAKAEYSVTDKLTKMEESRNRMEIKWDSYEGEYKFMYIGGTMIAIIIMIITTGTCCDVTNLTNKSGDTNKKLDRLLAIKPKTQISGASENTNVESKN
jgi:hypothetical protein